MEGAADFSLKSGLKTRSGGVFSEILFEKNFALAADFAAAARLPPFHARPPPIHRRADLQAL